jgi:preprotein translocase subunit YajC
MIHSAPAVIGLQQSGETDYSFFIMMGMIFVIFYFLLIRPQQRRQKEQEDRLKSIEKGDSIVTSGGLHAKVVGVTDDILTAEIGSLKGGERIRVRIERSRVESVAKPEGATADAKTKGGKGGGS